MITLSTSDSDVQDKALQLQNLASARPAADSPRFQEVCGVYNRKAIEIAREAMLLLPLDKPNKERGFKLLQAVYENGYGVQIDHDLFEIYTKNRVQEDEIVSFLVNFLQTEVANCNDRTTLFRQNPWQLLLLRTLQNGYVMPAFKLMEESCKRETKSVSIAQFTVISCMKNLDKFPPNLLRIHRCFYYALGQKFPKPPTNGYAKQGVCQLLFLRSISAYLTFSLYQEKERTIYIEAARHLQKSLSDKVSGLPEVDSACQEFAKKFSKRLEKTP